MKDWYWLAAGSTWGSALLHLVQVLLTVTGDIPHTNKVYIATAGAVIYTFCAVALLLRHFWASFLITVIPLGGGLTVGIMWLAGANVTPDWYNLCIFAAQAVGFVCAGFLWRDHFSR